MSDAGELHYQSLTPDECFALLARVIVGRVGVSIKAIPEVLPVNFVLLGADVVFRTVLGSSLHKGSVGAVVAFEADHFDPVGRQAWSVLIRGRAHQLGETDSLSVAGGASALHSWATEGPATTLVRIEPQLITGRCLVTPESARSEPASGPATTGPPTPRSRS